MYQNQKTVIVLMCTYGCPASGLRTDWLIPRASRAWLQVSAREWMASENMLADPV